MIVAYIDARLVIERLNKVVPDMWTEAYSDPIPLNKGAMMWCHLTVGGITHSDVGESPKGMSKDLISDALKRAAVHFGIGVSIYALPQIKLFYGDGDKRLEKRQVSDGKGGKKPTLILTEYGHDKLRQGYAQWLETHGVELFGEPLDHGDVEGATIDEDELPAETGLADGHGDGSGPGWGEVPKQLAKEVEEVINRAHALGFYDFGNIDTVQMNLKDASDEFIKEWLRAARIKTKEFVRMTYVETAVAEEKAE